MEDKYQEKNELILRMERLKKQMKFINDEIKNNDKKFETQYQNNIKSNNITYVFSYSIKSSRELTMKIMH